MEIQKTIESLVLEDLNDSSDLRSTSYLRQLVDGHTTVPSCEYKTVLR